MPELASALHIQADVLRRRHKTLIFWLFSGSNYHLFTDHINPMWEDENNRHGGKWVVVFPKVPSRTTAEFSAAA